MNVSAAKTLARRAKSSDSRTFFLFFLCDAKRKERRVPKKEKKNALWGHAPTPPRIKQTLLVPSVAWLSLCSRLFFGCKLHACAQYLGYYCFSTQYAFCYKLHLCVALRHLFQLFLAAPSLAALMPHPWGGCPSLAPYACHPWHGRRPFFVLTTFFFFQNNASRASGRHC